MNYRIIISLLLLLNIFSVNAEERRFEIELLIFQRNVDINDMKEKFSTEPLLLDTQASIVMLNTFPNGDCNKYDSCLHKRNPVVITEKYFANNNNGFQQLDSSHLQFTEQRKKLDKHASFTPVLHSVWRMPVADSASTKPIHLFAGENFAVNTQEQTTDAQSIETQLSDKWAIDGNFKIYLEHYLFIDSQLIIRQQTTRDMPIVQPIENQDLNVISSENGVEVIDVERETEIIRTEKQTFIAEILFDQNRRLRSGEIHYLDHPMMGIIVQIRKIPVN